MAGARPKLAGPPDPRVGVPDAIVEIARGREVTPVWQNELGGLTFEVGGGESRCFVKWAPARSGLDLDAEATRLTWLAPFTPVPRVLGQGSDATGAWLVTSPVPGESAVSDRWKAQPVAAVTAIGVGLRHLHEVLPVASCPFSWSVEVRTAAATLPSVREPPPVDRLVVCHGDACAPNTIIAGSGHWSGHVDLGSLGVADRWADIAVATWSTQWNYGPGFEATLLDAYGIDPDPARNSYYRRLWDLT
ncbi:MAG: aminoglycoside 3'-phosphotransferase [Acidimicrobiia bacterium]|nr:aminoglycoside 3'-phosphotransferase [Acidimicrobiia bacterium]